MLDGAIAILCTRRTTQRGCVPALRSTVWARWHKGLAHGPAYGYTALVETCRCGHTGAVLVASRYTSTGAYASPYHNLYPTKGTGSARQWRPCTPARAAGLTDQVWTLRDATSLPWHVIRQPAAWGVRADPGRGHQRGQRVVEKAV